MLSALFWFALGWFFAPFLDKAARHIRFLYRLRQVKKQFDAETYEQANAQVGEWRRD